MTGKWEGVYKAWNQTTMDHSCEWDVAPEESETVVRDQRRRRCNQLLQGTQACRMVREPSSFREEDGKLNKSSS